MYAQSAQQERVSAKACALCHRKKIRCDLRDGVSSCSNCRGMDLECRPHERKRKRDQRNSSQTPPVSKNDGLLKRGHRPPTQSQTRYAPDGTDGNPPASVVSPPGSYLGRAEYISGIVPIDEEDAKMYPPGHVDDVPDLEMRYLRDIGVFDLPSRSLRESMITNYMERCNPWMPIVERAELEDPKPSILLFHAVCVAGSRVSTAPQAQASGQTFYQRAKALFHANMEKNPLTIIRAIIILQWWNPSGPEHVSMDASSFWLHMGVALAHQVGLHRESNPQLPDAKLRRRLWWVLFIRDCMISLSHGRPRAICMDDCDVRQPTLEDFPEENIDAHLFIAYVKIASILADITEAAVRGTLGRSRRLSIETMLSDWIKSLPNDLHLHDRHTGNLATYNFKARQLHVPYFTALTILYRPTLPGSNPSIAALLSSSFVAGIYEEFLARGEVAMLASTFIFHLLASAIAQLPCHSYTSLWIKAEPELEIVNEALKELSKRFPTAFGAQRVVKHVTQAVRKEPQLEGLPQLNKVSEQLSFFTSFGPELCSKWEFVYGSRHESGGRNHFQSEKHTQAALPLQSIRDDRRFSNDVSAASRPVLVNDPYIGSGPVLMAPPWTAGSGELSSLDGMMPSQFESDGQRGAQGVTFDSVGNWMLSDWMTDFNW